MIVLNVGGYKSGSTWVQNILQEIQAHGRVDEKSAPPIPKSLHDAIIPRDRAQLVWNLMNDRADKALTYKVHFYEQGSFELEPHIPAHVRFVNVVRDPRDAFVSLYYHDIGVGRFKGDFSSYFDEHVDRYLELRSVYDLYWSRVMRAYPQQVLLVRYEDLKRDYVHVVRRLISFLGSDMSPDALMHLYDIKANAQVGTHDWMKIFEEHGQSFYRKGVTGDYKRHFKMEHRPRFAAKRIKHWLRVRS